MKVDKIFAVVMLWLMSLQVVGQSDKPIKIRVLAVNDSMTLESVSNSSELIYPMKINMPTAFSPNQDGLNDTFGYVGEGVSEMKLVIFDRWGEKVFESTNVSHRWDGTLRGEDAPSGVYAYELFARSYDNVSVQKKGSVSLVR